MASTNPYEAPKFGGASGGSGPPFLSHERWDDVILEVVSVTGRAWRRTIVLTGAVDTEIVFGSGRQGGRVYVDGCVAAKSSILDPSSLWTLAVRFSFTVWYRDTSSTILSSSPPGVNSTTERSNGNPM